jgi:hypothetical protein
MDQHWLVVILAPKVQKITIFDSLVSHLDAKATREIVAVRITYPNRKVLTSACRW